MPLATARLPSRADCMAEAQDGFTPLHFCSQKGCGEGCRLLLGAGAEVDAKLRKTKKVREAAMGSGQSEAKLCSSSSSALWRVCVCVL